MGLMGNVWILAQKGSAPHPLDRLRARLMIIGRRFREKSDERAFVAEEDPCRQ